MVEVYKEVRKIFIKPETPVDTDTDTDSESEKLDIAQGRKSESGEESEQKGKDLKIITPKQMTAKLPILLAQLKAGNNSQKLKNEIKQIVYSLHRSKTLSKTVYNILIDTIAKWRQYL